MRLHFLASIAAAIALFAPRPEAHACGACFTAPPTDNSEVPSLVTSHRMALSISNAQTVLWDQIQYVGNPAEFAWVLPVKPGARVEVATDAWFDVLEAATSAQIEPPALDCSDAGSSCSVSAPIASPVAAGCGDGSGTADGAYLLPPGDGVEVVSRGSAGPYEAVILRAEDPEALPDWLTSHGYAIPADIEPIIESYVAEKFDFVALRLLPSVGVQQMRPVRVIQPGAVPSLPLRMVAAGTGPETTITLFVVGEGRWTTSNFPEAALPKELLRWDFDQGRSNYSELRETVLSRDGRTFLAPYSMKGALFAELDNPVTNLRRSYLTTNKWRNFTIAEAYVEQAFINGETSSTDCTDALLQLRGDGRRVVDPCGEDGCRAVDAASEIDVDTLMCDPPLGSELPLDDLAMALVGMHPRDVWLTRLDARLARSALAADLVLAPAASQTEEPGILQAGLATGAPCELAVAPVRVKDGRSTPSAPYGMGLALGVLTALAALRRAQHHRSARPSASEVRS